MTREKVLVTGSSGFIGSHLVEHLRKDYDVIGIDKNSDVYHKDVKFYQQDINDEPTFKDKVDIVIHLAAKAGVRDSQDKFDEYVHDNILGTKSVLDNCIKYWKPSRVYIASSSSIYGDTINYGYCPKSLYAMSKVATEMIATSYRNSKMLHNIYCMRLFTVYGPKQRKGLAMREFIDKILKDEPITVYGDGTQSRDFTYIDDLCKAIKTQIKICPYDWMIDMGNSHPVTLNSVIHTIAEITGKDITIHYESQDIHDVMKTCSDRCVIENPTSLYEGLRKQIEWQKKELNL